MENATKALMIAAAILVAILVISLGIGIFNNAAQQAEGAGDLSEYQIQQFNDKFKKFEGTSVSGAEVNALLTTVFNHNLTQPDATTCIKVTYPATTGNVTLNAANNLTASPAPVSTAKRYKVVATYSTTTKLITSITVTAI